MSSAAILFETAGFSMTGKRLLGRQSAGHGFLRGLARYGSEEALGCYTEKQSDYEAFRSLVRPWLEQAHRNRPTRWVRSDDLDSLATAGTVFRPDPGIAHQAWLRRFHDQRAYSLCGVTHTIASRNALESLGALLTAPVQPWDAVICTSESVRTAVGRLLDDHADYLEARIGARPRPEVELPVIPLGIDTEAFAPGPDASDHRRAWRERLGAADDDVVVLYLGRLIFYAKAHPVPMYLALEEAARRTGKRIHLVQAGWFEDAEEERAFHAEVELFCPSVVPHFPDGRRDDVRTQIWRAADVFVSLSDNIQETFGLTPIEAMAAGLPVVVSDWDGYRESVVDGEQGFCIPTLAPPPGAGEDLAEAHVSEAATYSSYIGHTAMATAVELKPLIAALTTLVERPDLRRRFGAAGIERAKHYDWSRIVPRYEALWHDLARIRNRAAMAVPRDGGPAVPLADDPFRMFGHYATRALDDDITLRLPTGRAAQTSLAALAKQRSTRFGANRRPDWQLLQGMLRQVREAGAATCGELVAAQPETPDHLVRRGLGYLLKFGLLERVGEKDAGEPG